MKMNRRNALKRTAAAAGSAALTPGLFTLLQACKQQPRIDWSPKFLSEDHAQLISAVVDTILPKTETPGGLDVKVDMFLDLVFAELYDTSQQAMVVEELDKFDQTSKQKFGASFSRLDKKNQQEMLKQAEASSGKFNGKVWGTAVGKQEPVGFYRNLKSLILWGYFTSEEIGKNVLSYDPVPGAYLGCIPLSEVGNTWSL